MTSSLPLLNCTPHDIHIVVGEQTITYKASPAALVRMRSPPQTLLGILPDGVPVFTSQLFVGTEGLPPDPKKYSGLIVSMPVGEFLRDHGNPTGIPIYGPDSSPEGAVRNAGGQVIGSRRLVRYAQ